MAGDTAKLRGLLQNLPQELYDEVYDLTFTASPDTRTYVDENWTSSHLLQVDRSSRHKYAASFFGTIFVFQYARVNEPTTQPVTFKWLKVQSPASLSYARGIEFVRKVPSTELPMDFILEMIKKIRSDQLKRILRPAHAAQAPLNLAENLVLVYEEEASGRILARA